MRFVVDFLEHHETSETDTKQCDTQSMIEFWAGNDEASLEEYRFDNGDFAL